MTETQAKVQEVNSFVANLSKGSAAMRPYIDPESGKAYVLNFKGGDAKNPNNYVEQEVPVQNAALRYDEWRTLDDAVVRIAEDRLIGFGDLRERGLVRPLPNAMATTVLTWEEMSDAMEAFVSIDPARRGDNDVVDFNTAHIPIPVTHVDYQISDRVLQESRNRGTGLDTNNAERAARKVAQKWEDMLFGSTATITYGGGTIHSYVSHPDVNDVTLSQNWDASGKTPAEILADVIAMKQACIDDNFYGPWYLYVPTSYETVLDEDYSVSGQSLKTIRQRILDISGIEKVTVVDRLPDDTCVLVTMQRDVVDLIDGIQMQNVQWSSEGGFIHHYKVMGIQVPRVKSDYGNKSGIALLS